MRRLVWTRKSEEDQRSQFYNPKFAGCVPKCPHTMCEHSPWLTSTFLMGASPCCFLTLPVLIQERERRKGKGQGTGFFFGKPWLWIAPSIGYHCVSIGRYHCKIWWESKEKESNRYLPKIAMLFGVAPSGKNSDFTARLRHLPSLFFFCAIWCNRIFHHEPSSYWVPPFMEPTTYPYILSEMIFHGHFLQNWGCTVQRAFTFGKKSQCLMLATHYFYLWILSESNFYG